jgi:hypothetical protein
MARHARAERSRLTLDSPLSGVRRLKGTPTKRQVSKRQISKRPVSKRPKRQGYKMSGLQNVRLQNVRFQNVITSNITKRPFSKKYIDLTYVMLGKVGSIAFGPHSITLCWVRLILPKITSIYIYSVLVVGGNPQSIAAMVCRQ